MTGTCISHLSYHARKQKARTHTHSNRNNFNIPGRPPQYAPVPCRLTFDLLTLKVVSESHLTWATSVPIFVFLGLAVLDLGPMYATERQTSDKQTSDAHHRLMPPAPGAGHNKMDTLGRSIGHATPRLYS